MLPIFIIAFLLVQVPLLQAEEFPSLMKHVDITWDNINITSKVDTRHTMSTDGYARSFIFCGPFKSYGNDGNCTLKSNYQYYPAGTNVPEKATANQPLTAKFISSINSSYSCMNIQNNIIDFIDLYSRTEQSSSYGQYSLSYTCQTVGFKFTETIMIILAVIALLAMIIVGVWGYKRGQKKCLEESLQNSSGESYQVSQGNSAPGAYGGNNGGYQQMSPA